jgi:hypothetical protein
MNIHEFNHEKFNALPPAAKKSLTFLRGLRDSMARELIAEACESETVTDLVEEMLAGDYMESNCAQLQNYFGKESVAAEFVHLFKTICQHIIELEIATLTQPLYAGFETVSTPPQFELCA